MLGQKARRGIAGVERVAKDIVKIAQARQGPVEHGDIRAHARRDAGRVGADDAAADDQQPWPGQHRARRPSERHGRRWPFAGCMHPPVGPSARPPRTWGPAAAGRHGRRSRFHRQSRCNRIQADHGLIGVGGEVQIGKQKLPFAQHLALDRLGFLHLHDHVGTGKDFLGGVDDLGAGGLIGGIVKAGAQAGTGWMMTSWPCATASCARRSGSYRRGILVA